MSSTIISSTGAIPHTVQFNNYANEKKKEDPAEYEPWGWVYNGLEGLGQYGLISRYNFTYMKTYAVAFAVGAFIGLVKPLKDAEASGLQNRAEAFSKGDIVKKIMMAAEVYLKGPALVWLAEKIEYQPVSLGNAVILWHAFHQGKDAARWAYNTIKP